MAELNELETAVLRKIAKRPAAHGYNPVEIRGVHRLAVSGAVQRLYRCDYVSAAFIKGGFGPAPDVWQAGPLTERGRAWLQEHV